MWSRPVNIFQFHYGSIKGMAPTSYWLKVNTFQFHYGSIKGAMGVLVGGNANKFQFHYGSIKGKPVCSEGEIYYISIPLWFD